MVSSLPSSTLQCACPCGLFKCLCQGKPCGWQFDEAISSMGDLRNCVKLCATDDEQWCARTFAAYKNLRADGGQPELQIISMTLTLCFCVQQINIDDKMKAIFLLCSLPASWDIFCTIVRNSAPNGTLVYIDFTSSLLLEKMRQKTMGSSQ
ncbi:hypothetical protein L7F22_066937 [Adiantum nelumboides]|nr:hypothetical protein [Adiantum nelumboides]